MTSDVIIIGGPTASGKSQEAMILARQIGGEIINGDSMQMYAHLSVLTARPSQDDLEQVPHHLYGVLTGEDWGSVASWYQSAVSIIQDIRTRGLMPIIVGGTGLYLRALTHGLSPVPEISQAIRDQVRHWSAEMSNDDFYAIVLEHDPSIEGTLHPSDTQRLTRALEVILATGQSIRSFQGNPEKLLEITYDYRIILPPREELYQRINQRVHHMVEQGALEEVFALLTQGLPADHPIMKAVGVREFAAYHEGVMTLNEAISAVQQATRQYAKRQMTWFRRES